MAASSDYLKLGQNQAVLKLLCSNSSGNELVLFSDQVLKLNRRSAAQRRVLMITNRAIYNLERTKCKRRINVADLSKVIRSRSATAQGEQFVIKVANDYDYHYCSSRTEEIMQILQGGYRQNAGANLNIDNVEDVDLTPYVTTRIEFKRTWTMGLGTLLGGGGADGPPPAEPAAQIDEAVPAEKFETRAGPSKTIMHYSDKPAEKVELADFELLKVLGKGSFGKVMLVRKKDEGGIYAMKVLSKAAVIERHQMEHTKAERNILQSVQHPFLVGLRFAFQNEAKLYMVLDYLNGGELFFHLKQSGCFPEPRAKLYAAEITLGLGHLHSLGIVYRDLKPENILLDKDGHIRITDFGLAKEAVLDNSSAQTFCGTPEYLAPEILSGAGHGRAVDWWSLGTLVYEMLAGLPPFYDTNLNVMYKKILQDELVFKDHMSLDARDMLAKLLDRDAEKRLGSSTRDCEDIKVHAFFSSMDWEKLFRREIQAPFKPSVSGEMDASNFDSCFTNELAQDTFVEPSALKKAAGDQGTHFSDFTFKGPSNMQKQ